MHNFFRSDVRCPFKQAHPKQVSPIAFTMEIIAKVFLFRVALSGIHYRSKRFKLKKLPDGHND